jgi:hypothetical protein
VKKNSIIIQGRGSIGVRHANNLIKLGYEPIFLRTKNINYNIPHDTLDIKETSDLNTALETNPIAAVIATPTIFHPENAIYFLERNLPTYIEKPLGFKISESRLKMLEQFSKKLKIHGGFNFLYSRDFQNILIEVQKNKEKIISAEIVCHTNAEKWHSWENPINSYTFRKDLGGGVVHTCSHEVNFLVNLFPNSKIYNKKNKFKKEICTSSKSLLKEDNIHITLDLDFLSSEDKRYININLKDGENIFFSFTENNEKKIKEDSCFESIKNFVNSIENNDEAIISSFQDAKKTYNMCENLINE